MITIKKLAEILKVDVSTVSRALRDDPRVKETTKERVQYLAKELGYKPNLAARSLASGSTRTLWFILPELTDPVEGQLPQHTSLILAEKDYDLLVAIHQNKPEINERLLNRLNQGVTDGVFIVRDYSDDPCPIVDQLVKNHYPIVFLDRYISGQEGLTVTTDNEECSKKLVELCAEQGASFFVSLFTQKNNNMVERNRLKGALSKIRSLKFSFTKSNMMKKSRLKELPEKISILASSQMEILEYIRNNHQLLQEKKLYFGTFDQWIGAPSPGEKAFVCIQDFEKIGRLAVDKILEKISSSCSGTDIITKVPPKKFKIVESIF